MEVLISIAIGIILMELYVWLDSFSKWLVRWAANKLPHGRDAEFQAQWEADLASIPNSLFKLYFVLRDCVVPIKEIQQMMFREELADIADSADVAALDFPRALGDIVEMSATAIAENESARVSLMSSLDEFLERLQRFRGNDTHLAIDKCSVLKPDLESKFYDYSERTTHNYATLLAAAGSIREKAQRVAEAQLRIRNRILDDKPIQDADGDLLESLVTAVTELGSAVENFKTVPPLFQGISADLMPAVKVTCEAFKAAARLVKAKGLMPTGGTQTTQAVDAASCSP